MCVSAGSQNGTSGISRSISCASARIKVCLCRKIHSEGQGAHSKPHHPLATIGQSLGREMDFRTRLLKALNSLWACQHELLIFSLSFGWSVGRLVGAMCYSLSLNCAATNGLLDFFKQGFFCFMRKCKKIMNRSKNDINLFLFKKPTVILVYLVNPQNLFSSCQTVQQQKILSKERRSFIVDESK